MTAGDCWRGGVGPVGLTVATSHFVDLFVMPRTGPDPAGRSRVLCTLSTPACRAGKGGGDLSGNDASPQALLVTAMQCGGQPSVT